MEKQTYNYEDLIVWQRAMELVEDVYRLTSDFPREELYGLTSQIRRAAFSIPLNVSEGQGRKSKKEFMQFLLIARSSAYELNTALHIATRIKYMSAKDCETLRQRINELTRMISGLINSLK